MISTNNLILGAGIAGWAVGQHLKEKGRCWKDRRNYHFAYRLKLNEKKDVLNKILKRVKYYEKNGNEKTINDW